MSSLTLGSGAVRPLSISRGISHKLIAVFIGPNSRWNRNLAATPRIYFDSYDDENTYNQILSRLRLPHAGA